MCTKNKPFFRLTFFIVLFSSFLNAVCTPAGTAGDDNVICTGSVNGWQKFYGGSDNITLNSVSGSAIFWLDELLGGNPMTDGNDTFISINSDFNWVFAFGGDDKFDINNSKFSNVYADTNPEPNAPPPYRTHQRGNDTISIENSVSNGWILGGNDNDSITIKNSRVSFVASGYSDILSDIQGYLDYTPFDGNDTIILDNVDFSEPNYYYNGTNGPYLPSAVGSGKADDLIVFKNGGNAYGVSAGHGNDQIIVEDMMLFNDCNYTNERGNMAYCGIYSDEPYEAEINASTIALHGDDEIIIHAGDLSRIVVEAGHGSDLAEMYAPSILLDTNISGGDDRSVADGFVDRLVFHGWVGDINGSQLQNWESIVLDNMSEISFLDDNLTTGFEAGTDTVTDLPYGLLLKNDSSLKITHDFEINGNIYNDAIITMQTDGNVPGSTLTIVNNYSGNNGLVYLDTVLNDAVTSISDIFVVKGDTAGTTMLSIRNAAGQGGQTPIGDNEGILLVEVQGNSADNAFTLESSPLHASDYAYKLVKGSNANWYLQSYDTTLVPPADTIVALDASLLVNSYKIYTGQLPAPESSTTCSGPFTYVLQEDVKHGNLILDASNGSYSYEPDADYNGVDSFSYQIRSDQCSNLSNVATVLISVDCTTSQGSDSGDALGLFSILFLVFLTVMSGLYFIGQDESGEV